ncbi:hypothetical protein [Deinococcus arcticus]|uniref:Uncharacterized protein n=1 Tax=Deinococcus arcticus TaxID=2136176 RepID=A0A2T3W439_9DEIO|nr:hypothetical protein [Deinococcus arcticus]PTA66609.1 hypothetical protein C8263_17050 [Deinococcus arcticus]
MPDDLSQPVFTQSLAWNASGGVCDPRRSVEVGMQGTRVVVRESGDKWRHVGKAFRHRGGGGWNLLLEGGIPDETLVVHDAGGYQPGTQFRLMVTRPSDNGGTDWFQVGRAWVSREGRAVLATLDVVVPAGETKLVILPNKTKRARA